MLTFSYNGGERPPAPYVDLEAASPVPNSPAIPGRGKIDSGAAMTVIPDALVARFNLIPSDVTDLVSFDGRITRRIVYRVDLIIGSRRFASLPVTSTRRRNVLLGRDVMNQLLITLDGHQLTLTIHDA
jgi:predicted aspartyl protease